LSGFVGTGRSNTHNVRRLRPEHRRPDPADRLSWEPGDAAQCDLWFPPRRIPLEDGSTALLPVLVITAAHSRFITGRMIPTRKTEDLLLGSWALIQALGRVLRRLIWDNQSGIGRGGRLADGVAAFTGTLATRIVQLRPRDPESKGIVERRNGFFDLMEARPQYILEADRGKTIVHHVAEGELFGMMRLMKPVAALLARSERARTVESLRRSLESD
jgi:hypothetical protein